MDAYLDAMEAAYVLGPKNLCMGCKRDMGPMNPRQLCGKTHCPYMDEMEWGLQDEADADHEPTDRPDGTAAAPAVAIDVHAPRAEALPTASAAASPRAHSERVLSTSAHRHDGAALEGGRVAAKGARLISSGLTSSGSGSAKAAASADGGKLKRSSSDMLAYGARAPKMMTVVGGDPLSCAAAAGAVKRMRQAASALAQAASEFEAAAADVELALFARGSSAVEGSSGSGGGGP